MRVLLDRRGDIDSARGGTRGFVYLGGQMVALQGGTGGQVSWVHQDPVTKSQRITNSSGAVTSTIDLDPWGGETSRSNNAAFQPRKYTSYERDANGGDEAMMRRYQSSLARFSQPDPYDGSYSLTNPQSFNRYAYVGNDPVTFTDPTGLDPSDDLLPGNAIDPSTGLRNPGPTGSVTVHSGTGISNEFPNRGAGRLFDGVPAIDEHPEEGGIGGGGISQAPAIILKSVERCVESVVGRYLGREALTSLKQQGLTAAIGGGFLVSRFFITHAAVGGVATGSFMEIGVQGLARAHSIGAGIQYGLGTAWLGIKYYPTLVKESFSNKTEALRALRNCFE